MILYATDESDRMRERRAPTGHGRLKNKSTIYYLLLLSWLLFTLHSKCPYMCGFKDLNDLRFYRPPINNGSIALVTFVC